MIVGGAGSLYVNKEHNLCVDEDPNFPEEFKPVSNAHKEALKYLKTRNDVNWTYLSPAADFVAEGEKTGEYIIGNDELILNSKGKSKISYKDYAIAMIDEIENENFIQKRFTVVEK